MIEFYKKLKEFYVNRKIETDEVVDNILKNNILEQNNNSYENFKLISYLLGFIEGITGLSCENEYKVFLDLYIKCENDSIVRFDYDVIKYEENEKIYKEALNKGSKFRFLKRDKFIKIKRDLMFFIKDELDVVDTYQLIAYRKLEFSKDRINDLRNSKDYNYLYNIIMEQIFHKINLYMSNGDDNLNLISEDLYIIICLNEQVKNSEFIDIDKFLLNCRIISNSVGLENKNSFLDILDTISYKIDRKKAIKTITYYFNMTNVKEFSQNVLFSKVLKKDKTNY